MSELPAARAERFERELELSAESAQQLAFRSELGRLLRGGARRPRATRSRPRRRSRTGSAATSSGGSATARTPPIRVSSPPRLAALVGLVATKQISVGAGRQVLDKLVAEGGDPAAIVEAEGLAAIGGEDELAAIVAAALAANADAAERVRGGNAKAIGPIVGHVMRETKGRADGGEVTRLVQRAAGDLSRRVHPQHARGAHFGRQANGTRPALRQYDERMG